MPASFAAINSSPSARPTDRQRCHTVYRRLADSRTLARMSADAADWKRCSTCKKPIGFRAPYFACSVSTCNRKGTDFAFCSVGCWDAHVPMLRHRDAWADEKTSPTAEEWEREQRAAPAPEVRRRIVVPPTQQTRADVATTRPAHDAGSDARAAEHIAPSAVPRDVLVVVSKLKHYVRVTAGMNTSDDVVDLLSDRLRIMCDDAAERARSDGRKTVMARDFRR